MERVTLFLDAAAVIATLLDRTYIFRHNKDFHLIELRSLLTQRAH